MKTLNVMVVASLLVFGACSSSPDPAATTGKNLTSSSPPTSPAKIQSDAAPTDGSIKGKFDMGPRGLRLDCTGAGSPTVVLEAGDGVPSAVMGASIKTAFSSRLRVCSYDRANTGDSDSGASLPRRAPEVVSDLHNLLVAAKIPPPYVLVGHSAGGMLVQAYARSYPAEVSGVVALNPVPPWGEWARRAFPAMTAAERQDETAYFGGKGSSETFDYRQISKQIASMPPPATVPFHMVVATTKQCESPDDICARTYPAYVDITKALSKDWAKGRFTQAGSGHELYLTDSPVVNAAIDDVLARRANGG